MDESVFPQDKLFMVLLGSKAPARNVEQHDYFFGIAKKLKDLVPSMRAFWPEAGNSIHIDGWREVTQVSGYQITILPKDQANHSLEKLFFINLGGYQSGKLEEQHYTVLSVHQEKAEAIKEAKKTIFFKNNTIKGAGSHIDEKYGIDVDDIYNIEDILAQEFKNKFHIQISPSDSIIEDPIQLGYFKLEKLK